MISSFFFITCSHSLQQGMRPKLSPKFGDRMSNLLTQLWHTDALQVRLPNSPAVLYFRPFAFFFNTHVLQRTPGASVSNPMAHVVTSLADMESDAIFSPKEDVGGKLI